MTTTNQRYESIPIARLRAHEGNRNRMDPERYALLVRAVDRAGFLQPILVQAAGADGSHEIIDGHHRVRAAGELGMESVPAIVVATTDDDQLRLGMNRLRGELDLAGVAEDLAAWAALGARPEDGDLELTGFTPGEIDDLLAMARRTSEELEAAAPPDEAPADEAAKPFALTIEFAEKGDYDRARRALKRAAGRGGDLGAGLLRALGLEEEGE